MLLPNHKITLTITILSFCTQLFFVLTEQPLFNFIRNMDMKSAQNVCGATVQNCPTCRVILCSLKCVSLHLYKRLHFVKVKYLYGAETRTLGTVEQKYLESFEIWCWRRMEISWTKHVRNEVLHRVKVERNIIQTIKRRKANGIGHIWHRNCLLIHIFD